ncbi:MAG: hypothetical protein PHW53_01625 [Patescibacteria group bacterium]|nr:hypothetical protein [Patescibacteria group bacterium]
MSEARYAESDCPDGGCEPMCIPVTHAFSFAEGVEDYDVASRNGLATLVWRDRGCDMGKGHIAVFELENPPAELTPIPLETDEDLAVWNPRVLWHDGNPQIFWTRYHASDSRGTLVMAEYDLETGSLGEPKILFDQGYYSSLGEAVFHPSGEYGLVWAYHDEVVGYQQAMFARFSLDGELKTIQELGDAPFTTHGVVDTVADGYSLAYTVHPELDPAYGDVWTVDYSLVHGLGEAVLISPESGRYSSAAIAPTLADDFLLVNRDRGDYSELYFAASGSDGLELLDSNASGSHGLGALWDDRALLSWCGSEDDADSLHVQLVGPAPRRSILDISLPGGCQMTHLLGTETNDWIFWLDSTSKNLSYRKICN